MMTQSTVDPSWAGFLGRPIQQRDDALTRAVHAGRSILLTGAAGSISSVLARAIAQTPSRRLILLDRSRRRLDSLTRKIQADSPSAPQLANDPFAAIRHSSGIFVMISTDKAANPHSIMGATRRIVELILMRGTIGRTFMRALRPGNVLASRGSVVPEFNPSDTPMALLDSQYHLLVRA